jgi:DME family drug/metabolite transporter
MFYYLRKNTGVYYVIMAGMLWSMIGIGIRLIENANVWQILLYRSSSLVLFLFIVLLINTKKNPFVLIYQSKLPVFIAAFGLFIAYSGGIYAVQNTSVANAMLLFASAPLITSILGYYFLGEKLSLYTFLAILIAFLGIFIMFMDSFGNNSINGSIGGVISAFGFSIFTVSLRWGKQNNMLPSVFLSGLLAILMTVIICKIQNHNLIIEKYDAFYALFLGIFQVGIGLILYTAGSKTVPAAELTLLSLCEVLLAPIWVWIFLGEGATRLTFIGGFILLMALIFNSIFLIIKRNTKKMEINK